jgi:phosphomannomutase
MKSLIIFDLDGTLAESKSDLDGETATLLPRLVGGVDVASISGGAWGQFENRCLPFCRMTNGGRSSTPRISASTK